MHIYYNNYVLLGPTYKKSIDNIAEILCDKLESLEVHAITISPLKLLAIQIEVRKSSRIAQNFII